MTVITTTNCVPMFHCQGCYTTCPKSRFYQLNQLTRYCDSCWRHGCSPGLFQSLSCTDAFKCIACGQYYPDTDFVREGTLHKSCNFCRDSANGSQASNSGQNANVPLNTDFAYLVRPGGNLIGPLHVWRCCHDSEYGCGGKVLHEFDACSGCLNQGRYAYR